MKNGKIKIVVISTILCYRSLNWRYPSLHDDYFWWANCAHATTWLDHEQNKVNLTQLDTTVDRTKNNNCITDTMQCGVLSKRESFYSNSLRVYRVHGIVSKIPFRGTIYGPFTIPYTVVDMRAPSTRRPGSGRRRVGWHQWFILNNGRSVFSVLCVRQRACCNRWLSSFALSPNRAAWPP